SLSRARPTYVRRGVYVVTDRDLLRAFARRRCGETFRPLVDRYLAFVYSTALRQNGDPERAEEVSHAVFLALARKARQLPRKTVLPGWLFRATRIAGLKAGARKQSAGEAKETPKPADASSNLPGKIPPQLDHAIERLSQKLRDAVVL